MPRQQTSIPLVFILLLAVAFLLVRLYHLSFLYLFLALVNCIICICEVFSYSDKPYSLHKIVQIFILFFFVVANAIQYSNGATVTSLLVNFTSTDYEWFQFFVLVTLTIYNIVYYYSYQKYNINNSQGFISNNEIIEEVVLTKRVLILSIAATSIVVLSFKGDIIHMFLRGLEDDRMTAMQDTNVAVDLVMQKLIRTIPLCSFLIYYMKGDCGYVKFLLFLLTSLTLFPTGLGRNSVAMYWLPIILLVFARFWSRPNCFSVLLIMSLLIIFPFFDNFRFFNGEIHFSFSLNYLNSMNFDASQNMMAIVKMRIVTYGRQLLGVLFFFVPRSIWPTKPYGSGHYVADIQGVFSNISMPFWGEGYINFGMLGSIIFCIILAIVTSRLDYNYWRHKNAGTETHDLYYLLLIGSSLFILRGDLLSSIVYTVGLLASFFIVRKFAVRTKH